MTRENAISTLKKEIECRNNTYCAWSEDCEGCSYVTDEQDLLDALEMAIKALEQNDWIPVGKREPEEYGEYMITWLCDNSEKPYIGIAECEITNEFDYGKGRFKAEWLLDDYIKEFDNPRVVAWMPLPEPYEENEK